VFFSSMVGSDSLHRSAGLQQRATAPISRRGGHFTVPAQCSAAARVSSSRALPVAHAKSRVTLRSRQGCLLPAVPPDEPRSFSRWNFQPKCLQTVAGYFTSKMEGIYAATISTGRTSVLIVREVARLTIHVYHSQSREHFADRCAKSAALRRSVAVVYACLSSRETTEDPAARCTPASSGPQTLHEKRPLSLPFLS